MPEVAEVRGMLGKDTTKRTGDLWTFGTPLDSKEEELFVGGASCFFFREEAGVSILRFHAVWGPITTPKVAEVEGDMREVTTKRTRGLLWSERMHYTENWDGGALRILLMTHLPWSISSSAVSEASLCLLPSLLWPPPCPPWPPPTLASLLTPKLHAIWEYSHQLLL